MPLRLNKYTEVTTSSKGGYVNDDERDLRLYERRARYRQAAPRCDVAAKPLPARLNPALPSCYF